MASYQKLAGEVGGLIESVKHLTNRVKALEHAVAEIEASIVDHIGRPLRVGDRVRQVGYWHGGRLADVGRVGTVQRLTHERAVVLLDSVRGVPGEQRSLGGVILRRLDDEGEPAEAEEASSRTA